MLCRKRNGQPPRGNNRSASRRGFSLVELIVVMVIIAMLAGIVMLNTRRSLISARQNTAKAQIKTIVDAIDSFYAEQGRYPSNEEGLAILAQTTPDLPEPYMKDIPEDPWNRAYDTTALAETTPPTRYFASAAMVAKAAKARTKTSPAIRNPPACHLAPF